MEIRRIGIIMNGVTGRMGTNQHLIRSILAIRKQGGVKINEAKIADPNEMVTPADGMIVQVGKRKFAKLKINK